MCKLAVSAASQLSQLVDMTVLSVDTGDLKIIKDLAATGKITDATTNPLFVSQAGQNNDPTYAAFVTEVLCRILMESALGFRGLGFRVKP